jgi:predicted small lipoprotein YifL
MPRSMFARILLLFALCVGVAVTTAACGRKGPLEPPTYTNTR